MRLPKHFRTGHDGSIACRHRDLSCCASCANTYPEHILDVHGVHFWYAKTEDLLAMLGEMIAWLWQDARAAVGDREADCAAAGVHSVVAFCTSSDWCNLDVHSLRRLYVYLDRRSRMGPEVRGKM